MPTIPIRRRRRGRRTSQGQVRRARAKPRCAATCCCQNLEVQKVKQQALARADSSITPQKVPLSEIMHFSRQMAAFVRSGIPIIDGDRRHRRGHEQQALPADPAARSASRSASGVPFSRRARRARGDPPAVLPRHPALRRADRPARRRARAALGLHRARPRGQEQAQVGADVPVGRAAACRSSPSSILMVFVLPKFVDFFDDLGAKLPLLDAHAARRLGDFSKNFWYVYVLGFVAAGVVGFWAQRTSRAEIASATRSCSRCPSSATSCATR